MSTYISKIINAPVPQSEPLREDQVQNSAGGFAWAVDKWTRLKRFLILGSEGGSYYASERALTLENAKVVAECVKEDGQLTIGVIATISKSGRAPKNTPALYALAVALCIGDEKDKEAVRVVLPLVARTGTHIMQFAEFVQSLGGWGRAKRKAIAGWYTDGRTDKLAYQAIKYRQREGWTHADLLRLSHPKTKNETRKAIFDWMCNGWPDIGPEPPTDEALRVIWAYEKAQRLEANGDLWKLISDYNLPREALPTESLNHPKTWDMLLWAPMPMTAMIRNLGKMTSIGTISPNGDNAREIVRRLGNRDELRAARVHPLSILLALNTYKRGAGVKGSLTWEPVKTIVDALDAAFYLAFENVPTTNKRWYLGIDVSGSMTWGEIAGMTGISPRIGSAAMSLVTAAREPSHYMAAFTDKMQELDISPRMRLDDVCTKMARMNFGGTDCALPMLDALKRKMPVDVFVVYTDSETWAGPVHPKKALDMYREKMGIPAKLIVVGMLSNGFTIADPTDSGMMDVVGFDTAAPAVMSDFASGGSAETAQVSED